jgi:hypothetical protein
MPKFVGIIGSIGRVGAGVTGGITGNTTITITPSMFGNVSTAAIWDSAAFGLSVTTIGTQAFNAYVTFPFAPSTTIPIAGLSGIATTVSTLLPVVNERTIGVANGSTQFMSSFGVPTPTSIVFGNSATPGQSYSAVVYAILQKAD